MSDKNNPEEIRFKTQYTVSNIEYMREPKRVMARAEEFLRMKMAYTIIIKKKTIINDVNLVDISIDLYVATPERFWEIVNREAEKIATRFMSPPLKGE